MINKIKNISNLFLTKGFFQNKIFKFIHTKVFWRNRYVLFFIFSIITVNILIWFFWVDRIMLSGFAVESQLNFILNIPVIPRTYSLVFINYLISLTNLSLAIVVYNKNKIFAYILFLTALFLSTSMLVVAIYYILMLGL